MTAGLTFIVFFIMIFASLSQMNFSNKRLEFNVFFSFLTLFLFFGFIYVSLSYEKVSKNDLKIQRWNDVQKSVALYEEVK